MADAYHHAQSSVRRWGGTVEDYLRLHQFLDSTKRSWADPRHRAILHNTFGIGVLIDVFGQTLTTSTGRVVPTRWVGEQHCFEDVGFIPTIEDWLRQTPMTDWMRKGARTFSRTISLTDTLTEAPSA